MKFRKITAAVCALALAAAGSAGVPAAKDTFGIDTAVSASALQSSDCGDNIKFSYTSNPQTNTNDVTLYGSGEMWNYDHTRDRYSNLYYFNKNSYRIGTVHINTGITSVGNEMCYQLYKLRSVSLPMTIKRIGKGAFEETSLENITIPEGVEEIGARAFYNTPIEYVILPSTVKTIGDYAFSFTYNLDRIQVSKDNPYFKDRDGVLFDKDMKTLIAMPTWNVYGANKTDYTVPDGVTKLAKGSFYNNYATGCVEFPSSLTTIDDRTFEGSGFKRLIIPASVTYIGDWAFAGSTPASIAVPKTVTHIGEGAFGYYSDDYEKMPGYTLWCCKDSAAEEYALDNGIDYQIMSEVEGDISNDSVTDVDDLVTAQKIIAGWKIDESTSNIAAADLDGSTVIDIDDLILMQKTVAGWNVDI